MHQSGKGQDVADVSAAYHLWDELFAYGLRMALSPSGHAGDDEEAWDALLRAHGRSLQQRDEMWVRIAEYFGASRDDR